MIIATDLNPTGDFTRILNDVIFDERLTAAEFRVWCQLAALPKGQRSAHMDAQQVADELGMKPDLCRHHRRQLKRKGFLKANGDKIIVTVPDHDFKPAPAKVTKEQQLRTDLRDAWNKAKPDSYIRQRNPFSERQIATLRQHAEHLEISDLTKLVTQVLSGCKADSWWNDKRLNFDNVFGTGKPTQKKFNNVEKVYKLANSSEGRKALFDSSIDQDWLDWYHANGNDSFTSVVRHTVADRFEGWDHELDNPSDEVIQVYADASGTVVHWTHKQIPSKFVSQLPAA